MTEIAWGGLVLLALAALFVLWPGLFLRSRRIEDREASNRDWYLRRRAELGTADTAAVDSAALDSGAGRPGAADPALRDELLQDARLRLVEESDAEARETDAVAAARQLVNGPALLVVLALISAGLYWQLGASADVAIARQLQSLDGDSSEADYRRLMLEVEDRSGQRPDNLHYQAMLGRFYMNEGDYGRARVLYVGLVEQAPNDAGAAALAAQAGFMAAGRQLSQEDQLLAERALSIDPHQRTALGLLGMVAYERGEYQAAVTYWRRLLVMEDPDSPAAQMIRGVIARAEAGAGPLQPGAAPSPHAQQAAGEDGDRTSPEVPGVGITLRLELAQGMQASPGDTVFVFARNPALDTRMPVAVKRFTAAQLPMTLRLDDASSMAGQKISELPAVDVVARVSPSGQPGEQFATFQATVSELATGAGEQVHTLVLRPVGDS
jgi:cytochrome c-type biogenesis protein CcmH